MCPEPAAVDTNILVYALFANAPQHKASRALLSRAGQNDANLFVAAQSLAEFFAVVTNPRRVTVARSVQEAIDAVEDLMTLPGLTVLSPPNDVASRWCDLLRQHPVKGADIFDLQLIATILANGVHRLYTFNVVDFKPYSQVELLSI